MDLLCLESLKKDECLYKSSRLRPHPQISLNFSCDIKIVYKDWLFIASSIDSSLGRSSIDASSVSGFSRLDASMIKF